jgi:hypothetical protein
MVRQEKVCCQWECRRLRSELEEVLVGWKLGEGGGKGR